MHDSKVAAPVYIRKNRRVRALVDLADSLVISSMLLIILKGIQSRGRGGGGVSIYLAQMICCLKYVKSCVKIIAK